jgi:hypothetical protein
MELASQVRSRSHTSQVGTGYLDFAPMLPARLTDQKSQSDYEIPTRHRLGIDNPRPRTENAWGRFHPYRLTRRPRTFDDNPHSEWTYIVRDANFNRFGVFEAANAHSG